MGKRGILLAIGVACSTAHAGALTVTNGLAQNTDGYLRIDPDDYGCFGWSIGPNGQDNFRPPGDTLKAVSYLAGAYLFIRTSDGKSSAVVLTDSTRWIGLVEPGNGNDGVVGDHTTLTRRVVTANAANSPSDIQSAFTVEESPTGPVKLDFTLRQVITRDATTNVSQMQQTYVITNNGTAATDLIFHAHDDPDLLWTTNDYFDDIVGVAPGLCAVYARQDPSMTAAVALRDGGSSVSPKYYYGGKAGVTPEMGPPAYMTTVQDTPIWLMRGLPPTWQNHIAALGYNMVGESGTLAGTMADAVMGIEYRFALAAGQSVTIKVDRVYGSSAPNCTPFAGVNCGNMMADSGEDCDTGAIDSASCNANCTAVVCGDGHVNAAAGEECETTVDTATCNATTCTTPRCGDGHLNTAAGEVCDEGGDTATCNASNCQPPACGDGYVNAMAGEQCEDDTGFCDLPTCQYNFKVGGGCGGCGAGGSAGLVPLLILLGLRRRRR